MLVDPQILRTLAGQVESASGTIRSAAVGGSMLGGWTFGYLGAIVRNAVCR